ncbi:hypothetical protein [Streptosporangium sp. NBC_01756]|uniref:hypothetical protein n=1 Tax=Streptosporangium sp. NBC_01756 TaxID=2975950 RepID=UPI002DDA941C|nr:hypothetical protein [Streptosporangium sp. NBC_01756]WSC84125.1 hypothetical protein OIE48_27520 [Streptosporangium sp. NBC_01756]
MADHNQAGSRGEKDAPRDPDNWATATDRSPDRHGAGRLDRRHAASPHSSPENPVATARRMGTHRV